MQKNSNRKGLALGAVFALMASLLVGAAPAQANESSVIAFPAFGTEAQTTTLGTEAFDLALQFGNSVTSDLRSPTSTTAAAFGVFITKPAGVTVSATVSYTAGANNNDGNSVSDAVETAGTEFVVGFASSASPKLAISLPDRTSMSAAVTITVTPFLNLDRDDARDTGETFGTPITITFVPWSAMGAVVTLQQPIAADRGATASFTVTAGSLNWAMLENTFRFDVTHSAVAAGTRSAAISGVELSRTSGASASNVASGGFSASYTIHTSVFTTSGAVESLSAQVVYGGVALSSRVTLAVQAVNSVGVSISAVTGPNALHKVTHGTADARFNSTFSVRAFAFSASNTTSIGVPVAITVSGIANMELNANAGVVINGVTYTQSARLLAAGFTLPSGNSTFVVETFGQLDDSGDTLTLRATNGLQTDQVVITFIPAALTAIYTPTVVSGQAGASRTFALTVEDQWKQKPLRTDLRIAASVVLGGSTSETVSAPVVAGAASVAVTPTPATRTGSATVTFTLQRFDQDVQAWVSGGTSDTATWNIFSYAAGTDAITSRTASISALISYGVDLSWSSAVIAVKVGNSFSDVVVSAPGLMIQNSDLPSQTASDTLTINAATGQNVNVKFTSRLAGTYTVTFTNGTATTTSQVVVNPARDADGATITFDTTAIAAGSTKVITGTLRDINGNPVNTSGSATILVGYTVTGNAGIPIGTMPTETDADGKFSITVLTGANDSGTAVVSAAYYKSGAATPVAQVLTFNQSIVVGGAAAAPASDQKLTVGSFKGFVAIYALNYTGQKLSAKVAGRWLVENNLSRFERVVRLTGAAIPIKVDLYIDGTFVRTENIVTK